MFEEHRSLDNISNVLKVFLCPCLESKLLYTWLFQESNTKIEIVYLPITNVLEICVNS